MGTKTASIMLEKIWKEDNQYLSPFYRTNLRQLYLDVHYWTDYLCYKPVIDLFFKMKRVQILYLDGQYYVRMKLRTLLKAYGYKRRTQELLKYLRECMMFYHMQTYLRGKEECDIGEIGLDEMITIRVI